MPIFDKFKNLLRSGGGASGSGSGDSKRNQIFQFVHRDTNPFDFWEIVGELGDGAFGKVQKVKNRDTGAFAAAKGIELKAEDEIEDFVVEIDILRACRGHRNVVGLVDAYFFSGTLWVC